MTDAAATEQFPVGLALLAVISLSSAPIMEFGAMDTAREAGWLNPWPRSIA